MPIEALHIKQIRNLHEQTLNPGPGINILYGENGSGKTSVLEAIHFLGLTRSFRTHHFRHLVSSGEHKSTVFARIYDDFVNDRRVPLGVERTLEGGVTIRSDGHNLDLAELAECLPLQVIDTETFMLLDGSPSVRRQFLDWGAFHMSAAFIRHWRAFHRVLKQRNSLLKYGKIDPRLRAVWDREFITCADQLSNAREAYLARLLPDFQATLEQLLEGVEIELSYSPGWDRKRSLDEVLAEGFTRDLKQGFTGAGPQRADLRVKANGHNAAERLSRGQKKLVVSALKLAQGALFHRLSGRPCIYLIDDLPSELDEHHSRQFCGFLERSANQCFITCVDPGGLSGFWQPETRVDRFRIAAGQLSAAD